MNNFVLSHSLQQSVAIGKVRTRRRGRGKRRRITHPFYL